MPAVRTRGAAVADLEHGAPLGKACALLVVLGAPAGGKQEAGAGQGMVGQEPRGGGRLGSLHGGSRCSGTRPRRLPQGKYGPALTACPGHQCPESRSRRRCRAGPPHPCPPAGRGRGRGTVGGEGSRGALPRAPPRAAACACGGGRLALALRVCLQGRVLASLQAHRPPADSRQPTLMPGMMFLSFSILTKGVPSDAFWYSVSSNRICGGGVEWGGVRVCVGVGWGEGRCVVCCSPAGEQAGKGAAVGRLLSEGRAQAGHVRARRQQAVGGRKWQQPAHTGSRGSEEHHSTAQPPRSAPRQRCSCRCRAR